MAATSTRARREHEQDKHRIPPLNANKGAAVDPCGACHADARPEVTAPQVACAKGWYRFRVPTMDCASEESEIRRSVDGFDGIRALTFQLGQRTLGIDAPAAAVEQAAAAIRRAGFDPQPLSDPSAGSTDTASGIEDDHAHGTGSAGAWRLGCALLLAVDAELLDTFAPDTQVWKAAGLAVSVAAIWRAGFDVYKKGQIALRHGRQNINALMTVAVKGAFAIGRWPEAAMVMALYAIAEAIEARAVDHARNAIQGLLAMAPAEASVRQADGSWVTMPVASVALGAIARARPGERVPMDGVVST